MSSTPRTRPSRRSRRRYWKSCEPDLGPRPRVLVLRRIRRARVDTLRGRPHSRAEPRRPPGSPPTVHPAGRPGARRRRRAGAIRDRARPHRRERYGGRHLAAPARAERGAPRRGRPRGADRRARRRGRARSLALGGRLVRRGGLLRRTAQLRRPPGGRRRRGARPRDEAGRLRARLRDVPHRDRSPLPPDPARPRAPRRSAQAGADRRDRPAPGRARLRTPRDEVLPLERAGVAALAARRDRRRRGRRPAAERAARGARAARVLADGGARARERAGGAVVRRAHRRGPAEGAVSKVLAIYLMAGPELPELAEAAVEAGADLVEVGFPFSDPLADGPVIRRAAERALAHGMRTGACLEVLADTRARLPETPLVPMTYASLLEAHGWERFAAEAHAAGATSLIVADLPVDERAEVRRVQLVAPTSTDERVRFAAESTDGWLYLVTLAGTTGERERLSPALAGLAARSRRVTSLPLYAGFGISTPEQAADAAELADGVVVGTAAVAAAEQGAAELSRYVGSLRAALDAVPVPA